MSSTSILSRVPGVTPLLRLLSGLKQNRQLVQCSSPCRFVIDEHLASLPNDAVVARQALKTLKNAIVAGLAENEAIARYHKILNDYPVISASSDPCAGLRKVSFSLSGGVHSRFMVTQLRRNCLVWIWVAAWVA